MCELCSQTMKFSLSRVASTGSTVLVAILRRCCWLGSILDFIGLSWLDDEVLKAEQYTNCAVNLAVAIPTDSDRRVRKNRRLQMFASAGTVWQRNYRFACAKPCHIDALSRPQQRWLLWSILFGWWVAFDERIDADQQ